MGTVTAGGNPTYTIAGGGEGGGFSVNPQTGAITVTGTNIMGSQALLIQAVGASTSSYATATVSCGQAMIFPAQPPPSIGSYSVPNPPVIRPGQQSSMPQYSQYPMSNNIASYGPSRSDPYAKSATIPNAVAFDKPEYNFSVECSPGFSTSRVGIVTVIIRLLFKLMFLLLIYIYLLNYHMHFTLMEFNGWFSLTSSAHINFHDQESILFLGTRGQLKCWNN